MKYLIILIPFLLACSVPLDNTIWSYHVDKSGDEAEGEKVIVANFTAKSNKYGDVPVKLRVYENKSIIFDFNNITLPDSRFIKIDFHRDDGSITTIEHFIFQDHISENSGRLLEELLKQKERLEVFVDLSRVNTFMTTQFTFEIDTRGLKELVVVLMEAEVIK